LLFMVPLSLVPSSAILCFYINTFQSMCVFGHGKRLCAITCVFPAVTFETLHKHWYNHDNNVKSFNPVVTFSSLLSTALMWQLPHSMVK
jgi:hypothetical protein